MAMTRLRELPLGSFYQGRILNLAHRGAREHAPENTIPAFEEAAELGADGVELDVQLTADGVPVIFHDKDVERLTDGTGCLAGMTLSQVKELDAGAHFSPEFAGTRIPTLGAVFEDLGDRLLFNVELKSFSARSDGLEREVVQVIQHHRLVDRVLISSFNPLALRRIRRLAPELALGYLYAPGLPFPLSKGWLARPIIGPHEARHPHFSMVDETYVRWARRHRYRVNVWTVNDLEDIQRMRDLGVDAIMSDRPDLVQDVLQGER
jgi:glycerophosphoryl diester phosphodiesterase